MQRFRRKFVFLICFILTACTTTSGSGVNRHVVFQQIPKVSLPCKVVVEDRSRKAEAGTLEDRSGIMRTSPTGNAFGLVGVAVDSAIESMKGPRDVITEIESRGKFAAGEAFDGALSAISSKREDASNAIKLELIRFQPMLRENCYPGCPKLDFDLQFEATLTNSGNSTISYYSFTYPISRWSFFGVEKEKDVLREMTEYAVAHWAQQLLSSARDGNLGETFPPPKSDSDILENIRCDYNIFVRSE